MARCIGIKRNGSRCKREAVHGKFCARHRHQKRKCLANYHTPAHKCSNEPLDNGYCEAHQKLRKGLLWIDLNDLTPLELGLTLFCALSIAVSLFMFVTLLLRM